MSTEYLTVQPAPRVDQILEDGTELTQLPYPFHATEDGMILRQDFWQGKPLQVVGFQRDLARHVVDLRWKDAWADPQKAVGMYVVTRERGGGMAVHTTAIDSMTKGGDEG